MTFHSRSISRNRSRRERGGGWIRTRSPVRSPGPSTPTVNPPVECHIFHIARVPGCPGVNQSARERQSSIRRVQMRPQWGGLSGASTTPRWRFSDRTEISEVKTCLFPSSVVAHRSQAVTDVGHHPFARPPTCLACKAIRQAAHGTASLTRTSNTPRRHGLSRPTTASRSLVRLQDNIHA